MCYKSIENYSCGDKEEATIPCEGFIDKQICTQPEEAKKDVVMNHDKKCAECQHFDEQMEQIANNPELSKPAAKTSPRTDGPKLYFKERIRWEHCNHVSHPKDTNIERGEEDQEWLEMTGQGACFNCSSTHPHKLAEMKRSGALDEDDPWGAMTAAPEAAAGSSSEGLSNEAIAQNITENEARKRRGEGAPSAAPDFQPAQPAAVPLDEVEEDDYDGHSASGHELGHSRTPSPPTLNKKGKGRRDVPEETYATRYGTAKDKPEYSGEEDESASDEEYSSSSDEEDHAKGGRAARAHSGSHENSKEADGHVERSTSPGDDYMASGALPPPTSLHEREAMTRHKEELED